jgi:hypothetical protein
MATNSTIRTIRPYRSNNPVDPSNDIVNGEPLQHRVISPRFQSVFSAPDRNKTNTIDNTTQADINRLNREYQNLNNQEQASTNNRTNIGSTIQGAAGIASDVITTYTNDKAVQARENMNSDLESWKAKGAYWFDPNYDIVPTFDEYIQGYPSAEKALQDSQLLSGTGADVVAGFGDPGNTLVGTVFGIDKNKMRYAQNKELTGAISGYAAGGWVGAIAGGVIGLIQGFFGYGNAVEEDKKARQQKLAEYKAKYDAYKAAKRKQQEDRQANAYRDQLALDKQSYMNKQTEEEQLRQRRTNAWQNMIKFLSSKREYPNAQNSFIRT